MCQPIFRSWRRPAAAAASVLLTVTPVALPADSAAVGACAGERLTYRIRWGLISAGSATLSVETPAEHLGQPATRLVLTAATTPFLDKLYQVRDRIDAWVASEPLRAIEYRQDQHEGHYRGDLQVIFDHGKHTATRTVKGETKPPITIPAGTFDPLSALYALRRRSFAVGDTVEISVTDGKRCVLGKGKVLREEKVKTPAGTFDTFLVEPELHQVKGVFEKSPNAKIHIWLTKDARHMPVKVTSEVIIGHFTAELISIKP